MLQCDISNTITESKGHRIVLRKPPFHLLD